MNLLLPLATSAFASDAVSADGPAAAGTIMAARASTYAANVDWMFWFITVISVVSTAGIVLVMALFAVKYRQKDRNEVPQGPTHSTALEITWSVIPTILLGVMFWIGFKDFMHMNTDPVNPEMTVEVVGSQWTWDYKYPGGVAFRKDEGFPVPAGTKTLLLLSSKDVIHSFYVPQFRMKKDAVPGRITKMWFEAQYNPATAEDLSIEDPTQVDAAGKAKQVTFKVNRFDLFCAEYCGLEHSKMIGPVYVFKDQAEYAAYVKLAKNIRRDLPAVAGRKIYEGSCKSCHQAELDGKATGGSTGPSWVGAFGKTQSFGNAADCEVDRHYLYESFRNPGAKVVKGFPNGMSPQTVTDDEADALVEFIRSQKPVKNAEPRTWAQIDADRKADQDKAKKAP